MAKSSDVLQAPQVDAVRLGGLETSVGLHLRLAQLRAYDRFFEAFQGVDLRPGEFSVLWLIHQNPGVRQGQLAERLEIKAAHMTKMIRAMEDTGLVRRTVPDDDKRSVELWLTDTGTERVATLSRHLLNFDADPDGRLNKRERAQLKRLLRLYLDLPTEPSEESGS